MEIIVFAELIGKVVYAISATLIIQYASKPITVKR